MVGVALEMKGAAPARLREFDVMRGAAIIFVVYLHAWFSPWEVTPHHDIVAMHVIHLFAHGAVPVFLFIAAFLQARDRSPSFVGFQRKKALRVYVPMFTWMVAALLYRTWQDGWDAGLLRRFLLFDISGQFYYLFVLAFFFAVFFFVRGWTTTRLGWLAVVAFVVNFGAIVFYERGPQLAGDYATLAYRNPLCWVFFYASGFWAARRFEALGFARAWAAPAVGVAVVAGATYLFVGEGRGYYPISYFGVTVFLFSCSAIVLYVAAADWLLRSRPGEVLTAPLRWLSPYSFAIYLVHMPFFVGYVTTQLVSDSRVKDDYWQLMNSLFVVGFVSALLFVLAASALLPRLAGLVLGVERTGLDQVAWRRLLPVGGGPAGRRRRRSAGLP